MTIQWFPGHMAKAKREVQEKLKLVDFVIELVDARAPQSSQNPMLHEVLGQKNKLIVLMKKDLADQSLTVQWLDYFRQQGHAALAVDVSQKHDIQSIVKQAKQMGQSINEKRKEKGIKPRSLRAMILGIPNVGKSTLINRLANKKRAQTGDKPGVTKQQQWIKIQGQFELLDTPGILWPKFEDEEVGYKLAAIGSIKDQILPLDDIAVYILRFLKEHYPAILVDRYGLQLDDEDIVVWFDTIGKKRGCLESGGVVDYEKTSDVIIQDLRSGKLGGITFDQPKN
ncbi:ribosome biogenesis GTPase YlqF [Tenuibacillus multivorans]|uniref:Ribosome biogenesis GTPase A n=1 Tax=Tenuibacillus multivorans TaxID=237069 RepID=A0A1G9Y0J2_9BACI|nr:ribosome biogenesis GTPase YlqF [Tenuibacillus multivorans]GEL75896.1 ribosome biogenesis GTPase A [Tenuibacillus multivorans]SDN02550.1 ribosome biogenesis GTPase A [Tenuibacillus multivorans]